MDQNELSHSGEQAAAQAQPSGLTMEELLNQSELSLAPPRPGEMRTGVVASTANNEILVSIGAKSEGIIPSREVEAMNPEDREKIHVGQEIQVYVVSPESSSGMMQLSYTRSMEDDDWGKAEELMKSKETYTGTVDGFNKGGLIVRVGRLRGFVPASQISQTRRMRYKGDTPELRWEEMKGEPLSARVIEVDRDRRRLILSERAANQETREAMKERLLSEIAVGETRKGHVTSLADFGAFVNINGADGLVHLSELSWERVDHPSKLLKVGDEVEVKVISIDHDRKRIGLSMRQLQRDPWEDHITKYHVGQLVEGTVTRLVKFGAFARLDEHIEGLIHISELGEGLIEHPKEAVQEGDKMVVRIIKIEPDKRRIGLSLSKVDSAQFSDLDYAAAMAELSGSEDKAPAQQEMPAQDETPAQDEAPAKDETPDETPAEPVQAEES